MIQSITEALSIIAMIITIILTNITFAVSISKLLLYKKRIRKSTNRIDEAFEPETVTQMKSESERISGVSFEETLSLMTFPKEKYLSEVIDRETVYEFETRLRSLELSLRNFEISYRESADSQEKLQELELVLENVRNTLFKDLEVKLQKLESDLRELKDALFTDPETNLKIPLLKKDIDLVKEDNKLLREEMARMNDTVKWVMGIAITISFGLLTLAISIILTR